MQIDHYPPAMLLTGHELIPLLQSGVVKAATSHQFAALADVVAAGLGGANTPTGEFFSDQGALIGRFADRLFVGAAADNPGDSNRDLTPTDWLTTALEGTVIGPWPVSQATFASLSRFGNIGLLGASHTLDAPSYGSAIGVTGFAIADNPTTVGVPPAGWAGYFHYIHTAGTIQPGFAVELQAQQMTAVVGISHPYQQNVGGGAYALQVGSGGGETSARDAQAGLVFVRNPARFEKGIIFGHHSLVGTDGSGTGYGVALSLAAGHGIEWFAPDSQPAVIHFSTVSDSTKGSRIQHVDGAIVFSDAVGHEVFAMTTDGAFWAPVVNAQIVLGKPDVANNPVIDFHTSGGSRAFDVRMIAFGGDTATDGKGTLNIYAGTLSLTGGSLLLDHTANARLNLINIPTYANNAAAVTGGLAAGDVYLNSTIGALVPRA